MQLLHVTSKTTLADITEAVGSRNVEEVLHINNIPRTPNAGKAFIDQCASAIEGVPNVPWQKKSTVLNQLATDSDIFETGALASSSAWRTMIVTGTFPYYVKIPESVRLPDSVNLLGNGKPVPEQIYKKTMHYLETPPHSVDPEIFNEYSSLKPSKLIDLISNTTDPFPGFRIPWGEVSLYSSLANERVDFPVYPETVSDSRKANYTQMPDMLYQYEPWQIYTSSGPRSNTYVFEFHRDMWNGDHRDGMANKLIRFCEANCYPEYHGSAVYTSQVSLLIRGKVLITGVMTDVSTDWDGPIGLDGWYLHCKLSITITEVSDVPLDFTTIRNKGIIE